MKVKRRMNRKTLAAVVLILGAGVRRAEPLPAGPQAEASSAAASLPRVTYAGVRASGYGIRPFPTPRGWTAALSTMARYFPGSTPVAIWLVGEADFRSTGMKLEFPHPGDGVDYGPLVVFSDADKHDAYLRHFDSKGVKVFLQLEPGFADVPTLIDLVLDRYQHHPSVAGLGIDVEWYRNARVRGVNTPAGDDDVRLWEARVKAHHPDYRLFVKHYHKTNLPATYRGDVIFVDDSSRHRSYRSFLREMADFADYFHPNPVMFQIGYPSDRRWWRARPSPIPKVLGEALAGRVRQDCGIVWVDFSLRRVMRVR
jgi:hypothetical protein